MLLGLLITATIVLGSLVIPTISPHDPLRGSDAPLQAPNALHWFGTDSLGRDLFTRTFLAVRLDLVIVAAGISVPLGIGTFAGALIGAGRNSRLAQVGSVTIDAINAFPFIVLALGVVSVFGAGVFGVIMALWLSRWARYARLATPKATIVANSEYLSAAKLLGYGRMRILLRHLLPNVYAEGIAYAISDAVVMVLLVSSLSFLGAGVQPPAAELGSMIADGRLFLTTAWWISSLPGLVLTVTALGISSIGTNVARQLSVG